MEPDLGHGHHGGPLAAQGQVPPPQIPDDGAAHVLGQDIGVRQLQGGAAAGAVLHGLAVQGGQVGLEAQGPGQMGGGAAVVLPQFPLEDAEPGGGKGVRRGGQDPVPHGRRVRLVVVAQAGAERAAAREARGLHLNQGRVHPVRAGAGHEAEDAPGTGGRKGWGEHMPFSMAIK